MKFIYKYLIISLVFGTLACSSYTVEDLVDESSSYDTSKKVGIIVRTSTRSQVEGKDITKDLLNSINGYKKLRGAEILSGVSSAVNEYSDNSDRFYQRSGDEIKSFAHITYLSNDFLKYKSIGIIKNYITNNREELLKTMSETKAEGLLIFEVNCVISLTMQYMQLDSMLVALDKKLNIVYVDHQSDNYNCNEFDFASMKKMIINKASGRVIEKLLDDDIIDEI